MSTTDLITDLQAIGLSPTSTASDESSDLGQDDFLELMLVQLQNQNPLKPMENGEFLSQIAQFGTVTGIQDLQDAFNSLTESLYSEQALQAAGLVGRTVLVEAGSAELATGGGLSGAVDVPATASSVVVEITDPAGQIVRRLDLGQRPEGLAEFAWDGLTEEGEVATPGAYSVTARVGGDTEAYAAETLLAAPVQSVVVGSNGSETLLELDGLGDYALSLVRKVM